MIVINIDVMLARRKMSVTELSERVGITLANMSILKNGKARAIKLETLDKICRALDIPMELLPTRTLLVPHAREVLDYLHGRYTLSIVSNGFVEVQYRKIRNSGIAGYFDHIVLSEEAGALKPDKRIFEHALRLNDARPDEALMVGDLYQADIAGAQNASIDQAYFNWRGTPLPPANAPTYTIRSLRELMEIL